MSSIGSMNAIINNNRKLLKDGKRKPFTKSVGGYSRSNGYKLYKMPEVFPHVLRRIRIKTRRQNRRLLIKQCIIGFVVLVSMIVYVTLISN